MDSVEIMFPKLHDGITNIKGENTEPYNYVSIVDGHAIITTLATITCVNLKDYFLNYIILQEEEIEPFNKLMDWMDGKFFTKEFWSYLVFMNKITVINDSIINITGDKFDKRLVYTHDENITNKNVISRIVENQKSSKYQLTSIGISNETFKLLNKTIGRIINKNPFIFEFIALNSTIRFTVDSMPCVFGIILTSNQLTTKQFLFDGFKSFAVKTELTLLEPKN